MRLARKLPLDSFMQAIEFTSQIENGHIAVPKTIRLAEGQAVRVMILPDGTTAIKDTVESVQKTCGNEQRGHGREANWLGHHRTGAR